MKKKIIYNISFQQNKLRKRYDKIDAMRLFFAFCVVVIHVPLLGGSYLAPIYRCAVPFFYTVTGYFLHQASTEEMIVALMHSSKKWFIMWMKYFIIITLFSAFIHWFFNQSISLEWSDISQILSGQGICSKLDVLFLNEKPYGISVLWFLLSGSYAMALLSILFSLFSKSSVYTISLLCFICMQIFSCFNIQLPRVFGLSLPFLTLGIILSDNIRYIFQYATLNNLIVLVLLSYCEFIIYKIYDIYSECFLFTPILTSLIFAYLVKNNTTNKIVLHIAEKGRSTTLDIYIYHRAIWLIISVLCKQEGIKYVGAIVTFIVAYILSELLNQFKYYMHRK